jgi:hypothetical protein
MSHASTRGSPAAAVPAAAGDTAALKTPSTSGRRRSACNRAATSRPKSAVDDTTRSSIGPSVR